MYHAYVSEVTTYFCCSKCIMHMSVKVFHPASAICWILLTFYWTYILVGSHAYVQTSKFVD